MFASKPSPLGRRAVLDDIFDRYTLVALVTVVEADAHLRSDAAARFAEPGRAAFEFSLALSALSLAFPWLVIGSVAAAARAWQRRSPIAWRALLAAAWCCLLGLVIRQYLGFGIFP